VTLTWWDNSFTETGFEIDRFDMDRGFSLIATVGTNTTTYVDSTAVVGKDYFYRVRAVSPASVTGYSNIAETGIISGLVENDDLLRVYPNPVKDHLQIRSNDIIERFTLYQLDGKVIENNSPRSNAFAIDMRGCSSGMYLLKIEGSNEKKVIKILKQ
jgi:hypothetical protein